MNRIVAILRLLAILLCLVPFTNVRQVAGKNARLAAPASPASESRVPGGEEEDHRESADGKERLLSLSRYRPPARWQIDTLTHAYSRITRALLPITSPSDVDPFHNGLGTPYLC